jgi:hypothetical protein
MRINKIKVITLNFSEKKGWLPKMDLFFSELNNLNTPRSTNELSPLNTNQALSILGRFAEGLLLNETITVPINGPALTLVVLIRWLGHEGTTRLIEEGAVRFCFLPGTLAYISEANKRALSLSCDTGILSLIGKDRAWEDINDSVKLALVEQLDYPAGKARRFGRRLSRCTTVLSHQDIFNKIETSSYSIALDLLKEQFKFEDISALKKLDNRRDKEAVTKLLNIASANVDLTCSSVLNCTAIYGNELTWQVVDNSLEKIGRGKNTSDKLNKILQFENIPNIPELVLKGWPAAEVIKMRTDPHVKRFREWLETLPDSSNFEIVKSYYESFKKKISEKISLKILKLGVPTVIGLLGPTGKGISMTLSVVNTLWGNRIINGWNPHVFIEKHFQYKYKDPEEINSGPRCEENRENSSIKQ